MMSVPIRRTPAFEALRPVQLFRVTPACTDLGMYDASADGQRFLINAAEAAEPLSVMVHVNWAARLRQP